MTSRLDQYRNRFNREPVDYRPGSATGVAIVLVILGSIGVVLGMRILDGSEAEGSGLFALVVAAIVVPAAEAIGGIGVWQGRRWGRWLALVGCGANLIACFLFLTNGRPLMGLFGLALYIGLCLQLCLDSVVRWCQR
ncbi:hypothetical protein KZZ52_02295 [Dactylosporangium sp. AC04546]|uniref:hypothetical protein n=1 Tax=Dactylosporangium sp. AC04546 TaxID=2862460 RepID=UPI001EDCB9E6|nr:hypothetical protein [Dactylosporangium sp. AC04546]WVK84289.1 hypothetical protein KZZ52_02295 [Dactylosporangium sp. AC04546]